MVGITETSGQIEIFPKQKKGMRLPFGCLPGKQHDGTRFLKFIRAFREREYWLVDWSDCLRRAAKIHAAAERQWYEAASAKNARQHRPLNQEPVHQKPSTPATARPFIMGVPKRFKKLGITHTPRHESRYAELLSRPVSSQAEANELWTLGILMEGTRNEVTKRLAWHLLIARKMSVADATKILTEWVYRTGRNTSKDVREDNRRGTRLVAKEVARIVQWTASRSETAPGQDRTCVSKAEADAIVKHLGPRARDQRLLLVALHFLRFAKLKGEESAEGWTVMAAVQGVIRRWPGCDGMKYKPLITALVDCGFIKVTREKRQTANGTGRPRTFLVHVPPCLRAGANMNPGEALLQAMGRAMQMETEGTLTPRSTVASDRYRGNIPLSPGEKRNHRDMEAGQRETVKNSIPRSENVHEENSARFHLLEKEFFTKLESRSKSLGKVYRMPDGQVIVRKQYRRDEPAVRCQEELERRLKPESPKEDTSTWQHHGPPDQKAEDQLEGDGL
jgi:hypothetical protein